MADKMLEHLEPQVAAISASSSTTAASKIDLLLKQIEKLTLEVAELRGRQRHQFSRNHSRSRSGNDRNVVNKAKRPGDADWLCRYHYRFRTRARNCEAPCSWREQKFESGKLRQTSITAGTSVETINNNRLSIIDRKSGERYLIDTGAEISVFAVKSNQRHSPTDYKLYAANGSTIRTYGEKTLQLNLGLRRNYIWTFVVADVKRSIIGADFLRHHNILVDLKGQRLIDGLTKLSVKSLSTRNDDSAVYIVNMSHPFSDILKQYPDIQRPMSLKRPPLHDVTHHLETTGPPIYVRPRPLPPEKYIEAKKEFEHLMDMGICRPSSSAWANPLHIVKKKNGQLRICGDYRLLNAMTSPDRYSIPRIQDFTFRLHGMKIFSKIDIKKAYYWIPMASNEDSQKTAVTTPFGLFEFTSMTFGLRNAAQTFQRFMHQVLRGLDDFTFSYIDDVILFSKDSCSHKQHLHQLFKRLTEYGLTINVDKCELGKQELDFLGYHVSAAGIKPPTDKTAAITSFPKPQTIDELRRFLGMINFYRDALPHQAEKQYVLNKYLHNARKRDKRPIEWTPEAEEAFEQCRHSIKKATTLSHPIPGAKLHIMTDASDTSLGGVVQHYQNSAWRPIAFFSKTLSEAQRKYSVYDRELLAMYTAVKHFRRYIEGAEVVIHTDHRPLTYALSKPPSNNDTPRRERQLHFISQFCTDIQFVDGKNNPVADALSRIETINCTSVIDYLRLAEDQEQDEELKQLRTKTNLKFAHVTLPGVSKPIHCEMTTSNPRPYLPASIRQVAFKALHELSHPGIRNTRKQMAKRYFWPNINTDVARWTKACLSCQRGKVQRHTIAPLGKFQEAGRFEHVHVDIVGKLKPSEDYTYIVTMIDRRTKWPEAIPVRDITAETVARVVYEHWICRYGCPLRLTTDQGRQFESSLFHALMKKLGVTRIRTTAYHPQANGQVERWHRSLKAALMARGAGNTWTKELPTVLLGLRAALHKTSDLSPALCTYGTTLRLPGDFFVPTKSNADEPVEFLRKLEDTMTSLASKKPKETALNTPFVHKDLSTCTHVFVRVDYVKKPLTPPYEGPYQVLQKHDKYFKIQLPTRTARITIDRLKPAYLLDEGIEDCTSTLSKPGTPTLSTPDTPRQNQPYVTRSGRTVRPTGRGHRRSSIMLRLAVLCVAFGAAFGKILDKDAVPQWSPVYSVKGLLNIPYAELHEPFYAWYDSGNGKSRIDYYGGMVKTYQLTDKAYGPYGTSVKMAPVTTERELNKVTCLQVNATSDRLQEVQAVLPDLTDFKYIGTETMQDSETAKWQMVQPIGDKINKYTMWVKYKKTLRGETVPIPVRYEMKGFNSLLGSHYDHYYLDYSDYDVEDIDPNVFKIDGSDCTSFPGPGARHLATFNPMKEFVHPVRDAHVIDEFERFKQKHSKLYASEIEHEKRFNIFRQNLRYVHSTNRARKGFSVAVNHLADRTDDELAALRGRLYTARREEKDFGLPYPYSESMVSDMSVKLPPEFDWRLFGAVTPVKDQSVCGSCWSFGTVGSVEGALFLQNGNHLVRLSQQALIDCSWGFGNNGCDGGEDFRAYQWIMKHGLPTEEEYGGYLGQDGYCHIDNVTTVTAIKGWVNVTTNDENALRLAIFKHGPISVAIDASQKSFSFYSHGVYFEPKCKNKVEELDHAVLAVGYGILNGQKYWLIKNSWSNLWGNDGYVLMSSKDNNCGVESAPTYVII